ncbi:hypothetical protein Sste5346_000174 [Sporothrix stenoceras]|uniref:Uncharacterized protein n=1 Tax=Sporothrix stenoceras TaxID=5173 RepID=A0ABR3ZT28_9PEZI
MSRQSIRNVLRTPGNALQGNVALNCQQRASLSCLSSAARPRSSTTASPLSTSSASATAQRRSTTCASILSPTPAWRPLPSSCQGQVRLLSATAPLNFDAITFRPSSSPELEDLLDNIRNKIILLSYLTELERRKIFDAKYARKLRSDPITREINGEIIRFSHMDLFNDIPKARLATVRAVSLMTTREDFLNLPRLLEGMHRAGRRMHPSDYARIARRAGERNCIIAVIECAKQVHSTGFRLENSEVLAEIFLSLQLKAAESGWDETETRQALNWAEQVVDLLEHPDHGRLPARPPRGHKGNVPADAVVPPQAPLPVYPLHRDPQVLAGRLHLAAAVADRFSANGADTDGKVSRYATELVQLWPAGKGFRALHPEGSYGRRGEMYYLTIDNKFLSVASPLLRGLDTAIKVLGGSQGDSAALVSELQARRDTLAVEVNATLASSPDRRGAIIYNKFFGEEGSGNTNTTTTTITEEAGAAEAA